jgi:hypothetical protein
LLRQQALQPAVLFQQRQIGPRRPREALPGGTPALDGAQRDAHADRELLLGVAQNGQVL